MISLAIALWSGSGYIGAFIRASNSIYEVEEGRSFWKLRPFQVFLVWLWLSNLAVLLGAELNAEIERERELKAGNEQAGDQIQLEPRSEPS